MQIWAGLGNPGPRYAMHRHNIGFMALDALAEVLELPDPAKKFLGWMQEARIGGSKIILLKPATFMNESGRSIRAAMDFYKLAPEDVTVFYDELDLARFKVKVRRGGGAAGHNGIRSTIDHIGPDFRRVRLGIGHPGHKDKVTGHVLGNFAKSEIDSLADLLGVLAAEAEWLAKGDDVRFMNDVALRLQDD
jgi:peptidyl-tRNA hydrolase, PTH1 family